MRGGLPSRAIPLSLKNYVFMITESYVRVVTNYCVVLFTGNTELRDFNYKLKFRQRIILLIVGTIFWIITFISIYQFSEYKRMQEIEKVDISDWENNRIKNK